MILKADYTFDMDTMKIIHGTHSFVFRLKYLLPWYWITFYRDWKLHRKFMQMERDLSDILADEIRKDIDRKVLNQLKELKEIDDAN